MPLGSSSSSLVSSASTSALRSASQLGQCPRKTACHPVRCQRSGLQTVLVETRASAVHDSQGSAVTGVACRETCPVPNFRSASFRGSTASDSTSHHTAVDIVDRASRPAGLIRQKEHDVVGEILRPTYAA